MRPLLTFLPLCQKERACPCFVGRKKRRSVFRIPDSLSSAPSQPSASCKFLLCSLGSPVTLLGSGWGVVQGDLASALSGDVLGWEPGEVESGAPPPPAGLPGHLLTSREFWLCPGWGGGWGRGGGMVRAGCCFLPSCVWCFFFFLPGWGCGVDMGNEPEPGLGCRGTGWRLPGHALRPFSELDSGIQR